MFLNLKKKSDKDSKALHTNSRDIFKCIGTAKFGLSLEIIAFDKSMHDIDVEIPLERQRLVLNLFLFDNKIA